MKYRVVIFMIFGLLISCGTVNPPLPKFLSNAEIELENLSLPDGFKIEVYANGVKNARSMELLPNGDLVVGTRDEGKVYMLRDVDQDGDLDLVGNVEEHYHWNLPSDKLPQSYFSVVWFENPLK